MTPELLLAAQEHALACFPRESSGVVIEANGCAEYRLCRNTQAGEDTFEIDPDDLASAEDAGRLLGYIHSHPGGPLAPSGADLEGCNASRLPWWIVDGSGWVRVDPVGRPFEGRQFVMGVDDCWSLVRDWYQSGLGVSLPDFTRSNLFWKEGHMPHLEHMAEAGFREVSRDGLEPGDTLVFVVAAKTANHCGVYLGNGIMLHHLPHQLSRAVQLDGNWQQRITKVVRYQ